MAVTATMAGARRPMRRSVRSAAQPMAKSVTVKVSWSATRIYRVSSRGMPTVSASVGRKTTYTVHVVAKKNWTTAR
jgi:hypothetical protein